MKHYMSMSRLDRALRETRDIYRRCRQYSAASVVDDIMVQLQKEYTIEAGDEEENRPTGRPAAETDGSLAYRVSKLVPFGEGFLIGHEIMVCSKCKAKAAGTDLYCRHCGRRFNDV